jgi:hypothetical protein
VSHKVLPTGTALALGEAVRPLFFLEGTVSARNLVLSSALLLPLLSATPAAAQRVEADIRIGGGPVSGRVIIGDRRGYDRYRPRHVGRVEWIRVRDRGFHHGWFKKFRREARIIVVYYDRRDDRYYDHDRGGWDRVRLYQHGGRYYRIDDDNFYDRYDDRDWRRDGRYDDRWEGRRDDRRDDRWDGRDDRRDDRRDGRRDDRRNDRRDDRRRSRGNN